MKYIQLSHHVNEFTNKHGNVSICVPMFKNLDINTADFSATIGEHWLISKTYTREFPD